MNTSIAERAPRVSVRPRLRVTAMTLPAINAIALVAVAVLLRGWDLGNLPGVNGDEAWSGVQALRLAGGEAIEWRTPSGNPVNWFFLLPMAALHAVWPPSFVLLRVVPLVSGLAALVINYLLCGRAFDTRTAVVSTIVLALMPLNIAYSRFAWDASQSLLATLFVLYLPLIDCRARPTSLWPSVPAMLALTAAMLVHPTNLFAAPLLAAGPIWLHRQAVVAALKKTAVPARTGMLVSVALAAACGVYWIARCLASGRLPLHAPAELAVFVENYWHLLSGATIYEYISGAGAPGAVEWSVYTVVATNWSFAALAVVSLAGVRRRLCDAPSRVDVILVAGWLTMLVGFFLVAGPGAIAPHFERYGICLVAPAALVLARGLIWWLDHAQRLRRAVVIVLAMAAWIWPLSFYLNYINYFEKTGGTSHATFRTAAEEPKQLALDFILEQRQPSSPVRIVCSQWWNYWPLAYLAFDKPEIEVLDWSRWQRIAAAEGERAVESAWFVEFADKSLQENQLRSYEAESLIFPRKEITDYSGGRVITVFGPREKFSQDY